MIELFQRTLRLSNSPTHDMRYSKKKQNSTAGSIRKVAGAFAVAGVLIYAVYNFGISDRSDTDASPDMTEEERVSTLAECLTASGARLYGAEWCSHCQAQKAAFGEAADLLNFVECADDSAEGGQAEACRDANITSYPTWVFGNGQRITGERSFWELARQSGCEWGG